MATARRRVLPTLAWVVVLSGTFMLFTGQWTAVGWVGAGSAGLVAGLLTVPLNNSGLFRLRFRLSWLRQVGSPLLQVFIDFAIVTAALARSVVTGRCSIGKFVARRNFPVGGRDPEGTAWRAVAALLATLSPNSYVVDTDAESGNRLSHDLVTRRASERPA